MKKTQPLILLVSMALLMVLVIGACQLVQWPSRNIPDKIPTAIMEPAMVTVPAVIPEPATSRPEGTRIHEIQGLQHRSPLDGKTVNDVYGIVTALKNDGFYLQDPYPDQDPGTSEGIFVSLQAFIKVKTGDEVIVRTGVVREFNPKGIGENSLTITQLRTADVEILSSGNPLPEPIVIGEGGRKIPTEIIDNDIMGYASRHGSFDPDEDGLDFFESLESMRVMVNEAIATSTISAYREFTIVVDRGKDAGLLSRRGILVSREDDFNPERIMVDDAFIVLPKVRAQAVFTQPIIGILTYDYGNYRLSPTQKIVYEQAPIVSDKAGLLPGDNQFSVATYNVENLGGAGHQDRFQLLAQEIVKGLGAPDLIALQEVQDNDGSQVSDVVSANQTIKAIINAIKKQGGPDYRYFNIDPLNNWDGGQDGGNIRVVLLYRTDSALKPAAFKQGDSTTAVEVRKVNGTPALTLNPGRISPDHYTFRDSRKPLAAEFELNGKPFFVVVAHLKSKGEDGPLYGDQQPPPLNSEDKRVNQAKVISNFISQIYAIDPQAQVLILGDLNDYPWSNPLKVFKQTPMNSVYDLLPEEERYSYIHEGNGQALDYILFSPSLDGKLEYAQVVHFNTDEFPDVRLSDHDPVYAVFTIR